MRRGAAAYALRHRPSGNRRYIMKHNISFSRAPRRGAAEAAGICAAAAAGQTNAPGATP